MNEVSTKVFQILYRPLQAKGVGLDQVVAGTSVPVSTLRNRKERIDWSDYVAIMRNVRPHFTDAEYIELGRAWMRSPGLKFAFVIARLMFSAMDFYRWMNKPRDGVGNQMFSCIVPSHREPAENEIEMDLTLPEGFEVCWDFFLISRGNMEELPRLLGLPRSSVTLTRIPRGARYNIVVPKGVPLFARVWRFLSRPFTARAAARELKEAHETLVRQATQLRTAHTLNELAQRSLDLAATVDTVANALVSEAGFTWAQLELTGSDHAARAGNETHEIPLRRTLVARAGQPIGELAVAPTQDADREEREQLLEFIVPGLAIALENALYRTSLERIVDERTTELRQARDDLAGTVDQLREAQGARERFFGNISHEIRTPLSIIMLATSDIEKRAGPVLDGHTRARLGVVTDAARKLVRLVDELLLLAAGQEGKLQVHPEPTDLAALLRQLDAAWRPVAEDAELALETRIPEALSATLDPVAIERVVTNLLSNAVKYTPRGGSIALEVVSETDGLRVSVFDTGVGIDEDLAGRLFGRFERGADRRSVGTGIGLALAKQLVEAHGGTIAAHRRDAGGSELRVVLPPTVVLRDGPRSRAERRLVHEPQAQPAPVAELRVAPAGLSSGTILLAEDDPRLAEMVAHLLGDEYTVIVAHDGLEALELMRRHQPQLLVTDVDMPRLDGIELSRRFREHTGDRLSPIIILSAVLDLGTRVAGLEAGAIDYVSKPFDPIELKARVRAQFRMRELALRLHRAEQLSALGILTAGLAHELRNPANGIVNAIHPLRELIPRDLMQPDRPVGLLFEVVAECADQINHLSRQLLGFRDGGIQLEKRPIYVRDLVDRALALTQNALTGIELHTALPPGGGKVSCAPPLILQVLVNLIENAAHAAGRGGRVELVARSGGDRIAIEVSDSGPGVPVELRERVFEPFFTTKPPGIGTGLGLSLARDIVHRHGGVLEIRDRDSRCTFVIELPNEPADLAAVS